MGFVDIYVYVLRIHLWKCNLQVKEYANSYIFMYIVIWTSRNYINSHVHKKYGISPLIDEGYVPRPPVDA